MLLRTQDAVILKQSVQHRERLSRRTGNGPGGEHAVLVGGVGIERDGALVITAVARIERGQHTPWRRQSIAGPADQWRGPDLWAKTTVRALPLLRCLSVFFEQASTA